MHVLTGTTNKLESFMQQIAAAEANVAIQSLLILVPEGNEWSFQQIQNVLAQTAKPIIGAVFPQIIVKQRAQTTGFVVIGFEEQLAIHCIALANDSDQHIAEQLDALYPEHYQDKTLLVFTDGLAAGCSSLIDQLFNHFGLDINFIGGGAGSLSLIQQPCIITNQGVQQGVAIMTLLPHQTGIGVAHGWEPITDTYRVTESVGNRIISLNWQPAFDIYQQVIANHSQQHITVANFFDIAKAYPFGITKLNAELVVRDPIVTENGHLICVGDVPQGSFVHILTGNIHTLPAAANEAKQKALASLPPGGAPGLQLFIDCISRVLFLQDHFDTELQQAAIADVPMIGALTLGEIANNGQDYLEFYNKTAVIGLFKRP